VTELLKAENPLIHKSSLFVIVAEYPPLIGERKVTF
jgi:hypothetical protein